MHGIGEIWRAIDSAPDYQVSSLGRVQRAAGRYCPIARELKQRPDREGYMTVALFVGRRCRYLSVHIVVLDAFVGAKPSPMHEGAHWDGDRRNNRLSNLRWATKLENQADTRRHRILARADGRPFGRPRLTAADVQQIIELYAGGATQTALAAYFNVKRRVVSRIINGVAYSHVPSPFRAAAAARIAAPLTKLSSEDVTDVLQRFAAGDSAACLARDFEVSRTTIIGVVHGRWHRSVDAGATLRAAARAKMPKRGRRPAFSPAAAADIAARVKAGVSQSSIAAFHNVSTDTIYRLCKQHHATS